MKRVLLLTLLLAAPLSAQPHTGKRTFSISSVPVLIDHDVDSPDWHWTGPGQDGSSKYALGATLDCRSPDGLLLTSARRNSANGAFVFSIPAGTLKLECQSVPTIHVTMTGPLQVGRLAPFDPRRRRPTNPPTTPFAIVYGAELLSMPPVMTAAFEKGRDIVLTGIATEGPNRGKRIWIVVQAQGGFPLPGKCGVVLGNEFCAVWP